MSLNLQSSRSALSSTCIPDTSKPDRFARLMQRSLSVIFRGFSQFLGKNISGSMDRMTGDVGMLATSKTEAIDYSLKCTPTQRIF